jgi:ketosteroid isomerase-like protein
MMPRGRFFCYLDPDFSTTNIDPRLHPGDRFRQGHRFNRGELWMSDTNKAVLAKANEAITQGDHEGFLAFCTEDTEWTFVGDRTLKGKEAVRRWMAETYREPPTFRVDRLIAEGDFLTALGEITLKDENGKTAHHSYCDVWRFDDGRMAELHAFVIETGPAR